MAGMKIKWKRGEEEIEGMGEGQKMLKISRVNDEKMKKKKWSLSKK